MAVTVLGASAIALDHYGRARAASASRRSSTLDPHASANFPMAPRVQTSEDPSEAKGRQDRAGSLSRKAKLNGKA